MPRFETNDARRFVWLAAAALAGAILTTSALYALSQRQATLRRASEEMANVADSVGQDIAGTFELTNTVLVSLSNSVHASESTAQEMEAVSRDVAAIAATAPRLEEILFAEVGGWVLASSLEANGISRNVARNAFFRQAVRSLDDRALVANMEEGRGLVVSRAAVGSDGTVVGVVASIVPHSYLRRAYAAFDAGRGIRVDLRRSDDLPLFAYGSIVPTADDHVIDRDLGPIPFHVSIRWSSERMLRSWSQSLPMHIGTTLGLLLLVAAVAWLVLNLLRRKDDERERLSQLVSTDALTGLLNRRAFMEKLRSTLGGPTAPDVTIVLVNLHRFKAINDVHGHSGGDFVLQATAGRLVRTLGRSAPVARLGGDEFAVLFIRGRDGLASELGEARRMLAQAIEWEGYRLAVGARMAIASFPGDGSDAEALLQAADIAMFHAKQRGANEICFFEAGMEAALQTKIARENELRQAIERREIRVYYQPLISLRDRRIEGFELLARWHHPTRGVVPPSEFIALAEETELITPLTLAMIREAAIETADWPSCVKLAINISPRQLREPLLAANIIQALRAGNLDPTRIEIELTEDGILDDYVLAKSVMSIFRLHGMTLALDDFGTGYSSLSHLRELRFDRIKIDRTFVQALPDNHESGKLVQAVVQLAESFDMAVTAEGIETEAQAAFLSGLKCAIGQGYLFGKPAPIAEATQFLRRIDAEAEVA